MVDKEKLIELAENALSPIWDNIPMPEEYYKDDYDLICNRECGYEWCKQECFELRGKNLKEQAIAEFIAAVGPNVTDELGWEQADSLAHLPPTQGAWKVDTQKIHPNFKSGPSFVVVAGTPRGGLHSLMGSAVCKVSIREKYHFIGVSCTVGKAEYEWANYAHITKFNPKYVLEQLGKINFG